MVVVVGGAVVSPPPPTRSFPVQGRGAPGGSGFLLLLLTPPSRARAHAAALGQAATRSLSRFPAQGTEESAPYSPPRSGPERAGGGAEGARSRFASLRPSHRPPQPPKNGEERPRERRENGANGLRLLPHSGPALPARVRGAVSLSLLLRSYGPPRGSSTC